MEVGSYNQVNSESPKGRETCYLFWYEPTSQEKKMISYKWRTNSQHNGKLCMNTWTHVPHARFWEPHSYKHDVWENEMNHIWVHHPRQSAKSESAGDENDLYIIAIVNQCSNLLAIEYYVFFSVHIHLEEKNRLFIAYAIPHRRKAAADVCSFTIRSPNPAPFGKSRSAQRDLVPDDRLYFEISGRYIFS